MEQTEKPSNIWIVKALVIGALAAGFGYLPLFLVIDGVFSFIDINKNLSSCNTLECIGMVTLPPICNAWLPAVGLGALGGFAGADISLNRFKRLGPWIGAVIGGLVAALMVATFVEIVNFSIWS
jgi:hypothetical protein